MRTAAQRPSRSLLQAAILMLALSAAACAPRWAPPPLADLNSLRFNERAGRPDYATTIRYIDDHVRYEDLDTAFVIGPTGDMCYVSAPGHGWCIPPKQVGEVGMDRYVEVHCSKWHPSCAYKLTGGVPTGRLANQVQVRERFEDRAKLVAAFHHLVYLLGGPDPTADPFAAKSAANGG
jgi:hypothetical protein